MKTRVQKWGNNLALRIPRPLAARAGLRENSPVELSLVEGKLIIQVLTDEPLTLDLLLRDVTEQNRHHEWDTGAAVGKEVW